MIATVNKNDLVALGFSEGTSKRIIRQGKELLIARGFRVYQNKRIGTIPATVATELLGFDVQNSTPSREISHGNS
ncbi:DUF3173 domain-containing protein [Streptococcus anginosus]|uniref:DUF3173 domain-containing protein n=1 Tax=Streptococcus anginosus TaxID=1328 RepID=UPI001C8B6283|nr:DUF3173 domain-containing protein [Streptococcus anginosus]MBX9076607.1 DUF3173 family protein [Streptococcus anginosus]MCW0929800.1 DUF3173 domain-containing protein [Streptococcus anginosus]MCW0952327.1 DUF3173 domain-containing protein [Streptococcus anginosus]MCW1000062.1 DUF3173 domain-containing protein [Streptococcus anginosus]MCW1015194.1 DUF3173 domain-containing protein [Streptococcus anginosus]